MCATNSLPKIIRKIIGSKKANIAPTMKYEEREITAVEFESMKEGFHLHAAEHGNPVETSDRFSFVATKDGAFVGCSSGLAYKKAAGYADWLYLTDLFVAKPFRRCGVGRHLLGLVEQKAASCGISNVWTWTAGYEAPGFYHLLGYVTFIEQTDYYTSGHARVGLKKNLESPS